MGIARATHRASESRAPAAGPMLRVDEQSHSLLIRHLLITHSVQTEQRKIAVEAAHRSSSSEA